MNDWKAKEMARAAAAQALQAANPHLVAVSPTIDRLMAACKNIRIELKRAFPKVKFAVRSSRYSGGDSINVGWIDGPTNQQVDEIVKRYQGGSFDGSQDLYTYDSDAWNDAFGYGKYVFSGRDNSDAAIASAVRTVRARFGDSVPEEVTAQAYKRGDLFSRYSEWNDWIGRTLQTRTWALSKAPKPAAMIEQDNFEVAG